MQTISVKAFLIYKNYKPCTDFKMRVLSSSVLERTTVIQH